MGPARRKKGPHAHLVLAQLTGLSPRRKDKEADPPRSQEASIPREFSSKSMVLQDKKPRKKEETSEQRTDEIFR